MNDKAKKRAEELVEDLFNLSVSVDKFHLETALAIPFVIGFVYCDVYIRGDDDD